MDCGFGDKCIRSDYPFSSILMDVILLPVCVKFKRKINIADTWQCICVMSENLNVSLIVLIGIRLDGI